MGMLAGERATQKPVAASNLNKKVDKRLDIVAEIYADAAGKRWKETISDMFHKKMYFKGFHYLDFLNLRYNYENRLFGISYNLELSTEIPASESMTGDCVFEVKSKGRLNIQDAEWICKSFHGEAAVRDRFLRKLNHQLVIDRIVALDMSRVFVKYKKDSDSWAISCESMIGSATWILIPPVTNLIRPREDECVKMLEFFELVSDAVANKK